MQTNLFSLIEKHQKGFFYFERRSKSNKIRVEIKMSLQKKKRMKRRRKKKKRVLDGIIYIFFLLLCSSLFAYYRESHN